MLPPPFRPPVWDIFCNVVDNYGDIGVCWRLARQLVAEQALPVRLWVDDLNAFQRLCPEIDPHAAGQRAAGVEIRTWPTASDDTLPGTVVIEAFACQLPAAFVERMAACQPPPVWVNLDYLSAESWVAGCHTLPSPHPRLALTKYFFFPGFNSATGGLLRERDLEARRIAFTNTAEQQAAFWAALQLPAPAAGTLVISLFAYENPALASLLATWAAGPRPIRCLAPETRTLADLEAFAGRRLRAGGSFRRGQLEVVILPFVAQPDYDRLLWIADLNLVRGEDSFVRAQWAARPMLWHIYPQDEEAHRVKLEAFLDVYCDGLSAAAAGVLQALFLAWNGLSTEGPESAAITPALWARWFELLPELRAHADRWAKSLSKQEDLCTSLVHFCRSKL
jgi:uncharacterized repeat protein (TIGR03837 family)